MLAVNENGHLTKESRQIPIWYFLLLLWGYIAITFVATLYIYVSILFYQLLGLLMCVLVFLSIFQETLWIPWKPRRYRSFFSYCYLVFLLTLILALVLGDAQITTV